MFSVSLNEAIGLHHDGFVKKSLEVVIAATLRRRLAKLLENTLRSLSITAWDTAPFPVFPH
jgi:hypothetical protein